MSTNIKDLVGSLAEFVFKRSISSSVTLVRVTLFDANGNVANLDDKGNATGPKVINVQPRRSLYYNPTNNNWRGSIVISAREAVSVLVVHQHLSPDKVGGYTGVIDPTPNVHLSLLLRNVYGLNSTLAIQNTGDTDTNVKVEFSPREKEDGTFEGEFCTKTYTVQASRGQNISLNALTCLGGLFVGSAYISNTETHPLAIASTHEAYQTMNAMSNLYSGHNILYAPLVQYGQPGTWDIFSSASVQNTGDSLGHIISRYYNVDGRECTANP